MSASIVDRLTLDRDAAERVAEMFEEHGVVRVAAAHPRAWTDEVRARVADQPRRGAGDDVQDLRLRGILGHPRTHAPQSWFPMIERLLGEGCIVGRVAACPVGHGEHLPPLVRPLFDVPLPEVDIPCYALAVIRPLADGCSVVVSGAHGELTMDVPATAALIADARHRLGLIGPPDGHAMVSVYQRHWFRNTSAGRDQTPLELRHGDYARYPQPYRQLFAWCFDAYVSYRRRRALARLVNRIVPPAVLDRIRR